MSKIPYRSLATADPVTGEFTEKKSRFIGNLFLVHDLTEVNVALALVRKQNATATHVAYAYILNQTVIQEKASDNGEPQGTAGAPILNALQKNDLTNILATVTRYFGGIKLGAGGLIRAYGHGVTVALAKAQIALYDWFIVGEITLSYHDQARMEYFLKRQTVPILKIDYQANVTLTIQLKKTAAANFQTALIDQFNDHYHLKIINEEVLPELKKF